MIRIMIIVVFTSVAPFFSALAQQSSYPSISGEIPVEVENDWNYTNEH